MGTYSQNLTIEGMRFGAFLGYTYTYNLDTFQNDRTYQEHSVSAHFEWWPFPDWSEVKRYAVAQGAFRHAVG